MNREYIDYIEQLLGLAEQSDYFGISLVEIEWFSQEVLKALEKQMPKKIYERPFGDGTVQLECPSCHCEARVEFLHPYCWHCGQKLDWSEE